MTSVKVSPWHDIPLTLGDGVFNFIVEIPKESKAKMETWEDPSQANAEVEGAFGDNDPVDVVEIGEAQRKIGEILKVKSLAALAMIDEGELDWKIVAISLDDPKAHLVNDVDDVEKHFPVRAKPDLIYRPYMDFVLLTFICGDIRVHYTAIRDWFRDYKIPDGKPANRFGLGDKPDYALKIIHETNESWAKLVKRSVDAGDLSLF
uniref:inorganic diphosphatase n=1 Tax=Brassica oleracea var. oleracea TaxID=109376 RepID=A0A0D3AIB2_BRAOL